MVRMSDLVRGLSPSAPSRSAPPPPAPAAPPAPAPTPAPAPPSEPRPRARAGEAARRSAPEPRPPAPTRLRLGGLPVPSATAERARGDVAGTRREPPAMEPRAVTPPTAEACGTLFAALQHFLEGVREVMKTTERLPWDELIGLVGRVVASLAESADLFWIANKPVAPAGVDYLAYHQARVAVLAVQIGANVGYEPERLVDLGMAGCLIDIGLWQLPPAMLRRLDTLSPAEQTQYRSHPRLAAETIQRWAPRTDNLVEAVLQHHEREQGQGFPQGLAGGQVDADAKILGLVDTFTGLTVPPSAKPRQRPYEAIRDIVKTRQEAFPAPLVKALLSEVSVFPPGTQVRLNTGEIGTVVAVNRNHPLRPRIEIADGKGGRLAAPKAVDLSETPFLYITGPVETR